LVIGRRSQDARSAAPSGVRDISISLYALSQLPSPGTSPYMPPKPAAAGRAQKITSNGHGDDAWRVTS
jgi:hypothetical protein